MGIYTSNGKPRFRFLEALREIWRKTKEDDEWEKKIKEGTGKGLKKKLNN